MLSSPPDFPISCRYGVPGSDAAPSLPGDTQKLLGAARVCTARRYRGEEKKLLDMLINARKEKDALTDLPIFWERRVSSNEVINPPC